MANNIEVSAITRLLLTKYNEKFDNIKECPSKDDVDKKISPQTSDTSDVSRIMELYLTDLAKLDDHKLFGLTGLNITSEMPSEPRCNYTLNKKLISKMSFIDDVKLVLKIIMFRKQEVLRELALMQLHISCYTNTKSKIANLKTKLKYIEQEREFEQSEKFNQRIVNDIRDLELYQSKQIQIINNFIDSSEYLFSNTLRKYNTLQTSIERLKLDDPDIFII